MRDEIAQTVGFWLEQGLSGFRVDAYGEELGMAENLAIEGRYSVRAPLEWSAEPHAGFTTGKEACRPIVEDGPFGFSEVNVTSQRRDPGSLLNWMERLIRRRRECPELGWGTWTLLNTGDSAVFAQRSDWEDSTIVAVHNFAGRDARARLVVEGEGALVDLFEHDDHELDGGEVELELPPYGAAWFRVRRPGRRLPP